MENLKNLVNNQKTVETFANLYARWQDERGYEDFNEYIKVMERSVAKTLLSPISIIKGTKRPFGVQFTYNKMNFHLFLKTSRTSVWLALKKL